MMNIILSSPKRRSLLVLGFPLAIGLCLIAPKFANACSPLPGSRPAAIAQRVSQTPYVFEGTVTRVDGATLAVRVNRYFKGQGPQTVRLEGFNQNSCHNFITEPGGRYLFFGEDAGRETWTAVYDGAFGSVRRWNEELAAELSQLGLIEEPNSPPKNPGGLPQSVADAVKREAAKRIQLPPASIQIMSAEPQTWQDACLGLPFPDRGCLQALTEGWLVTVRAGDRQLTYRTDSDGSTVYLDETNHSNVLPQSVANAVKREAAKQTQLPPTSVQIVSAEPQTWPDGCLGLFPDRICTQALVEGWLVTVRAGNQELTYRTDSDGSTVYLDETDRPDIGELPRAIARVVLEKAAGETQLSPAELRVAEAQRRTWDGCLGIEIERHSCTEIAILGWRVTVEGGNNRLVYHTNGDGSDVRLNVVESRFDGNRQDNEIGELPRAIANAVLEDAARRTPLSLVTARIANAQRRTWDGCLGIYTNVDRRDCPEIAILGWRVTVEGEDLRLVYHTNGDGSNLRLNHRESSRSRLNNE